MRYNTKLARPLRFICRKEIKAEEGTDAVKQLFALPVRAMAKVSRNSSLVIKGMLIVIITFIGCEDLLDIPPPETEIVRETVFESDDTALAALSGVYNKLINSTGFSGGPVSITVTEGVYADELISYATSGHPVIPYYLNNIAPANSSVSSMWSSCYNMIYSANAVIEGVTSSESMSAEVRTQIKGEALFLRAFIYFYLVNSFGPVPCIRTTNYIANEKVSRMPVAEVYNKIIEDLIKAKEDLRSDYPTANRVRVNKEAATALLARVYLYNQDWVSAEIQASEVINNSQYELLDDLGNVFLKESNETIWQLKPPFGYTNEGSTFILLGPPHVVALKNDLLTSFEPGDLRKENWTDSVVSSSGLTKWFFPFKYKVKNVSNSKEYSVVLRLAEQYLIRAEARVEQDKLIGANSAESDMNSIRARAGLSGTTATTKDELLAAIVFERKVELFAEWGHRFFDLKRWGKLDSLLGPIKLGWESTDALLPIPQSELLANPRLEQNAGY